MQDKIPTRKVDTAVYLSAVKEMIKDGQEVPLIITGGSMSPFLVHGRDRILIGRIDRPLRRGDMAFFQRMGGQYVMHRICRVEPGIKEGQELYYFIGDAQTVTEGPIRREQIFGVINSVCRKGKWIGPGDFWWEFFRTVWLRMIPFRRPAVYLYGVWYRIFRRKK